MSQGERLPKTLPPALEQKLRSSESESESSESESESSAYSDYSDYDDYSYSDYDSYSDYSEEEEDPKPIARNAFAKKRVLAGVEPKPVQPVESTEPTETEAEAEKKRGWRMPEEVKETLTKEAFDRVAEGKETVDVAAVKAIVADKGVSEAVVNEV